MSFILTEKIHKNKEIKIVIYLLIDSTYTFVLSVLSLVRIRANQ